MSCLGIGPGMDPGIGPGMDPGIGPGMDPGIAGAGGGGSMSGSIPGGGTAAGAGGGGIMTGCTGGGGGAGRAARAEADGGAAIACIGGAVIA